MLILIPVVAFLVTFLIFTAIGGNRPGPHAGWRHAFLQAAVTLGAIMVIFSELLSLLNALSLPWLAVCWGIVLLVVSWLGWQRGLLKKGANVVIQQFRSLQSFELVMAVFLGVILLTLFFIALISPPNNTDSLLYHMSRVMHWAQDRSLRHYPTAYEHQLINPIFAELSILNLRTLWGNDQVASLVQWFSMVGSLIGVSLVARLLGAGRRGQWAAIAFCVSLPMGILQSTSTQNDYVVAFFLIVSLYFVALAGKHELHLDETVSLGTAMGLGILSKGTAYPYFLPLVIWFLIIQLRYIKFRPMILQCLLLTCIVFSLNTGFWTRNINTYGNPLGPGDYISTVTAKSYNLGVFISSMAGNILMNFVTPFDSINSTLTNWYHNTFLPINPSAGSFQLTWGWNHEDMAGSPLHALLIPVTLVLLFSTRRRVCDMTCKWYASVSLGSFLVLMLVLKWDPNEMRLHLPFWISFAPLFGLAMTRIPLDKLSGVISIGLLLTTVPYVLFNRTRPLIAMRPVREPFTIPCILGCTSGSILNESPKTILFANWIQYRQPYSNAANLVLVSRCRDVGLRLDSHDLEYSFWWLLDAPQSGLRIESLDTYSRLQRYVDPDFKPCAILCTICNDKRVFHNLDLVGDFNSVRVYMGEYYLVLPNK
jgi:hypothetical protein